MAWLPIPQHQDYEVSDDGRVRSLKRRRPRQLCTPINKRGYVQVVLYKDGQAYCYPVHRLVLLSHIGPPPTERHECNHKDYDKLNNRVGNLEWVTPEDNTAHGHMKWLVDHVDRVLSRTAL